MKTIFDPSQSSWTPTWGVIIIAIITVVALSVIMIKSNHWTHRRKRKEDFDEYCRLMRTETANGRETELFEAIIHLSRRYKFSLDENGFANEGEVRDAAIRSLRRTRVHLAEDHEMDLAECTESHSREELNTKYRQRMVDLVAQEDAFEKRIISEPPLLRCFA